MPASSITIGCRRSSAFLLFSSRKNTDLPSDTYRARCCFLIERFLFESTLEKHFAGKSIRVQPLVPFRCRWRSPLEKPADTFRIEIGKTVCAFHVDSHDLTVGVEGKCANIVNQNAVSRASMAVNLYAPKSRLLGVSGPARGNATQSVAATGPISAFPGIRGEL
jgi:hypothetical protein